MPGRGSDGLGIKEDLLKRFYPRVESLASHLKRILPDHARQHVEKIFHCNEQGTDSRGIHLAASLARLKGSYVCTSPSSASQDDVRWRDWQVPDSSQEAFNEGELSALVELAQARLLKAGAGSRQPSNMLTLGYREADDRVVGLREARTIGSIAVTNFYVNPLVSMIILGREWQHLWEQLGSAVMLYMFTQTSLFMPMSQGNSDDSNLMQVLGPSLSEIQQADPVEVKQQVTRLSNRRKRKRSNFVEEEVHRTQPPLAKPRSKTLEARSKSDSALVVRKRAKEPIAKPTKAFRRNDLVRKASDIALLRNRIYYARPIKSRTGRVALGLPIMHVFNRTTPKAVLDKRARKLSTGLAKSTRDEGNLVVERSVREERARKVVKYVWPREFGLHNVFTSSTSRTKTTERLQEYTNREEAIRARGAVRTPKRLQSVLRLIAIMLSKHDRVDYQKVLHYCCPSSLRSSRLTRSEKEQIVMNLSENPNEEADHHIKTSQLQTQPATFQVETHPASQRYASQATLAPTKPAFTKYRIATGSVSRFAQAVMRHIIPTELLGSHHNMRMLLRNIDVFVRQRRHESLNLHQLCQGMRVLDCHWLLPRNKRALSQRPTAKEMQKRHSLLSELIYYLFDSILIPLLRTNFYATESVAFRNRTIYFRQDDWNTITVPILEKLKTGCFTALNKNEAIGIMSGRDFGYSYIRLLPKLNGVRPIVNLRRRSVKIDRNRSESQQVVQQQQSINNILNITFQVLNYEKKSNLDRLGSSVFGAQDIYERLHQYRSSLMESHGGVLPRLYFVKVDVACAFDSIDQEKLLSIVQDIISHDRYVIQKFCQIMLKGDRVSKTWPRVACPEDEVDSSFSAMQKQGNEVNNVLFCDGFVYTHCERSKLIWLLEEHINNNLIKVGKEFCKQRVGIPQGSSLSTLLCCYYLAKMEEEMGFCEGAGKGGERDSLLMRYTDDFLFISTSQSKAKRFYETMKQGDQTYNMRISPDKSLHTLEVGMLDETNRLANDDGDKSGKFFPWCSYLINVKTLAVEYDLSRYRHSRLSDTLTINNKRPIQTLGKTIQSSIRNQGLGIFLDVKYNGMDVVIGNLYRTFLLAALKFLCCFKEIQRGHHGFTNERAASRRSEDTDTHVKYIIDCITTSIASCYTGIRCKVNKSKAAIVSQQQRKREQQGQGRGQGQGQGDAETEEEEAEEEGEERWPIDRCLFQLLGLHAFARILSLRPFSRKWASLLHDQIETNSSSHQRATFQQAHSIHIEEAWKSCKGIIASISI